MEVASPSVNYILKIHHTTIGWNCNCIINCIDFLIQLLSTKIYIKYMDDLCQFCYVSTTNTYYGSTEEATGARNVPSRYY